MRMSDWSSDVCSSDLRSTIDNRIAPKIKRNAVVPVDPTIGNRLFASAAPPVTDTSDRNNAPSASKSIFPLTGLWATGTVIGLVVEQGGANSQAAIGISPDP